MKLWDKGGATDSLTEHFTVGRDAEFDMLLAPFDALGSIAHAVMLAEVGLLSQHEATLIVNELRNIYGEIADRRFFIEKGVEDIHSQIELELTRRLGDIGKKIHSGRSRNDQIITDIALFLRHKLSVTVHETYELAQILLQLSDKHRDALLPGYTHFQVAMPSSFGLWFGAYSESFADDLIILRGIFSVINKNPLGSGAGYGSSFPLNRLLTTKLLGFAALDINSIYAQMKRGKLEKITADAISNIAATLAKMSMDITLYVSQNFAFVSFPDNLTTGSSIMPHKKNPDIFELIRAKCNKIQSVGNTISSVSRNLPSGYHRDMQIIKEILFPALDELSDCLNMMRRTITHIQIRANILVDERYRHAFSVEEVNRLVGQGVPFRDAYSIVAKSIESGSFAPDFNLNHTHAGSIGNLCNGDIGQALDNIMGLFPFEAVKKALDSLLHDDLLIFSR